MLNILTEIKSLDPTVITNLNQEVQTNGQDAQLDSIFTHSLRVTRVIEIFNSSTNSFLAPLSPDQFQQLDIAAKLHDIGKIKIPSQDFFSEKKLTLEEKNRIWGPHSYDSLDILGENFRRQNPFSATLIFYLHQSITDVDPDKLIPHHQNILSDPCFGHALTELILADHAVGCIEDRPYRQNPLSPEDIKTSFIKTKIPYILNLTNHQPEINPFLTSSWLENDFYPFLNIVKQVVAAS